MKVLLVFQYQVPLGVILKDENKSEDMVEILSELHKYVPSHTVREKEVKTPSGRSVTVPLMTLRRMLITGDQLTAARARGVKRDRANSLSAASRFDGLVPTAADFHVLLNLLDVSK